MLWITHDPVGSREISIHPENLARIRVLLVHRYRSFLWGLERLLESAKPPMEVAGTATTVAEALACLETAKPDVVLLDVSRDSEIGIEAIPRIMAKSPAKILMFAGAREASLREAAVIKGARGFVEKEAAPETILNAIRKVHAGELWLDRASVGNVIVEFARQLANQAANPELSNIAVLTAKERDVIVAAGNHPGKTAREIAGKLHISEHTMRNHLNSIYQKLGVSNRVELYAYAHRQGLCGLPIDQDEPRNRGGTKADRR